VLALSHTTYLNETAILLHKVRDSVRLLARTFWLKRVLENTG
jgi:hypothetical protein